MRILYLVIALCLMTFTTFAAPKAQATSIRFSGRELAGGD